MRDSVLPVAIIGAGPYGLSIAAHLNALQVPFRIFGEPMFSWREHMPRGMLLKSEGFASSLYDPGSTFTLQRYCEEMGLPYRDIGDPVPLERFVAYGLEFQKKFVPQLERKEIRLVRREDRNFALTTSDGETFGARRVIVAAGITHFAYLPPEFDGLSSEQVSHSFAHAEVSGFSGRAVIVVGGGSSAIDTAALLHEAGADVQVVARRKTIAFHDRAVEPRPLMQRIRAPWSGLGTGWRSRLCTDAPLLFHAMPEKFRLLVVKRHLGPAPGWFMKERVVGRFPLHLGSSIRRIEAKEGRVLLAIESPSKGHQTLEAAHVIAATGYRPEVRKLPFLDASLINAIRLVEGAPILSRNFESSVPGLYFVGLASANSFGPLVRFAFGAGFTARRLTKHLIARLPRSTRVPVPSQPSEAQAQAQAERS